MSSSGSHHQTSRQAYQPKEDISPHNRSNPQISLFPAASNHVPLLPLATPEDSDIDTSSSNVSTRDNTFSSNISTNTVVHITPPHSHQSGSGTLPPSSDHRSQNGIGLNEGESSTTLHAAPSISFTAASSSTALVSTATTGQLRCRGASLGRRSTFPRPLVDGLRNGSTSIIYRVTLLDGEVLEIPLKKSASGREFFNEVCQCLSLREYDYFGLFFYKLAPIDGNASNSAAATTNSSGTSRRIAWQSETAENCAIHHRGIPFWLKMDRRVVDQCKKNTRFWFGVRIYPPKPQVEVFDEITRYLLCLQLRQDLLSGRLACSFFTHTLLAAYWAQSELGDWDLHVLSNSDSTDYLTSLCLAAPLPFSILEGEVLEAESVAEEERIWSASVTGPPHPPPGLVPSRADLLFLKTAQKLSTYGIDFHRIQNPTNSTIHVNLTSRLSKETTFRRSQSMRPKSAFTSSSSKSKNICLNLSPSRNFSDFCSFNHLPKPSSSVPANASQSGQQYPLFLGVFHGGIYIYRGRLRLEQHSWSAIVKMAYQRASFRLCLRLPNSERDGLVRVLKCDCGTTALAKRIYRSCVDHHNLFRLRRLEGDERTAPWNSAREPFPFATGTRLRRLHPSGPHSPSAPASNSASAATAPPHLMSSIAVCARNPSTTMHTSTPLLEARARPLSEPDVRAPEPESHDSGSTPAAVKTFDRQGSIRFVRSAHKLLMRLFTRKSSMRQKTETRVISPIHRLHASLSDQGLQQQAAVDPDDPSTELGGLTLADGFESTSISIATGPSSSPSTSPFYTPSEWNRPPLPGPLWQMSSVDATRGMLFEPSGGLTVSRDWRLVVYQAEADKIPSTEWRGCRATWGVSENPNSPPGVSSFGPRRLFFEVRLNGNEPVRVGWATEDANLILGEDVWGFAYQTAPIAPALNEDVLSENWFNMNSNGEIGSEGQSHSGALVIGGASVDVIGSCQGDVIGCYLDLDSRLAHWTKNGVTAADMTISIARFPPQTVFYPACSIRNSSVTFNFGDTPFAYGPMLVTGEYSNSNWLPLASANLIAEIVGCSYGSPPGANQLPIRLTPNPRTGWHLIPTNSTGAILSPDRLCVRAILHAGWQTLHASDFITPWSEATSTSSSGKRPPSQFKSQAPSIYFEVRLLESLVTTPGAGVFVGFSTSPDSTSSAFPLGSEVFDTFGIVFEQNAFNNQTCLIHAGVKRAYGKALHRGDVVGCVMNPQSGLVFWSINGEYLGHIVQICAAQQHSANGSASAAADDVISIPLAPGQHTLVFTPVVSLANTSIEVNFGDGTAPLKHINKHTNCIPLCHYRRLLEGDPFYSSLLHQLPAPPASLVPKSDSIKKEKSQNENDEAKLVSTRHPHSFAQCRDTANQENAITVVHKSASCNSAPTTTAMNFLVSSDLLDALTILRSRIPLVPVKTGLWRHESSDSTPRRPITSPTFAAPWSRANQILPIVRTHRIAVSTIPPNTTATGGLLETEIDTDFDSTLTAVALALGGSLRRSASDSMHRALIRHLCGQSQQSSASAANQSSSSSLIERRMAQIPLVPTRIVHTRATYGDDLSPILSRQAEASENSTKTLETIQTNIEAGEETIARRRHITDLTLPPSIGEDDGSITSPQLAEGI
ncbi:hypothetical protein Aperf_G00000120275 [Anoplocephala perfoliata]